MKLIKPSFAIVEQAPGLEGMYKQIELAGRTCYKSENKITEDSAKEFVDRMIKSGHGAMLEHGTVYLYFPWVSMGGEEIKYSNNKYSKSVFYSNHSCNKIIPIEYGQAGHYITTNLRVLVENGWMDDLQYLCEPTEYHEKRITVKFVTDQGILREFTRHRSMSFAVESTRYCNYSKDKFNNEVTFIEPCWFNSDNNIYFKRSSTLPICASSIYGQCLPEFYFKGGQEVPEIRDWTPEDYFVFNCLISEWNYFQLLGCGWKPQQARNVLPLATKCEMIMTGFTKDWSHFFELRCPVNAHPQARELAIPLKEEFIKRNWL